MTRLPRCNSYIYYVSIFNSGFWATPNNNASSMFTLKEELKSYMFCLAYLIIVHTRRFILHQFGSHILHSPFTEMATSIKGLYTFNFWFSYKPLIIKPELKTSVLEMSSF